MAAAVKTALVLSAGGMFGAFQAGVWDVLSEVFDPDIVVGSSVGSLNGLMIASGQSGRSLIERWRSLESVASVKWKLPRSLHDGLLECASLHTLIQDLCGSTVPAKQFGVVLTEMPGLRVRLFRSPNLNWSHIAASCAVPLFLPSQHIDGSAYVDGGLIDPLPVWAAVQMGATKIISVNLLRHRKWYAQALSRAMKVPGGWPGLDMESIDVCDISPGQSLGSASESLYWSRSRTDSWIEMGQSECARKIPAVVEYLQR